MKKLLKHGFLALVLTLGLTAAAAGVALACENLIIIHTTAGNILHCWLVAESEEDCFYDCEVIES